MKITDKFKIYPLVLAGKLLSYLSRLFNLGHGSTWPGHITLFFYPSILSYLESQLKKEIILIAGTNGKTTTAKMIKTVLEGKGFKVIHNESGANLLNGIVSAFILSSDLKGRIKADYAIFEVDEATLPLAINNFTHVSVVLLNLFRDQLDRYGEVDTIARKWREATSNLSNKDTLILNADDPQIGVLGKETKAKVLYFGLEDSHKFLKKMEHATDSIYCLFCGAKLEFEGVYYSHLGVWQCLGCGIKRPKIDLNNWQSPLPGFYNLYNTLAAVLTCRTLGFSDKEINQGLRNFVPAFGRQEEFEIEGKTVKIFLSKNPVGTNEAIRTIISCKRQPDIYSSSEARSSRPIKSGSNNKIVVLLALNDQIPDGRDVSWIWDVDYEELVPYCKNIIVSGERAYDMGVRIKYSHEAIEQFNNLIVEQDLKKAIRDGLKEIKTGETLYALPTYTAMLSVRKILGGRKIL